MSRLKNFAVILSLVFLIITLIISGMFFYINQQQFYTDKIKDIMESSAELLSVQAVSLSECDKLDWAVLLDEFSDVSKMQVVVLSERNTLVASSIPTSHVYISPYEIDVISAKNGEIGTSVSYDDFGVLTMYLTKPKTEIDGQYVFLRLSYPIDDYIINQSRIVLLMIVVLLIFVVTILLVFTCNKLKTANEIIEATPKVINDRSISENGFYSAESVNKILEALNNEIEKLDKSFNKKNSFVNVMLANMDYGLIVTDINNNISLINPKAEELSGMRINTFFMGKEDFKDLPELVRDIFGMTENTIETNLESTRIMENAKGQILEIHSVPMFNKYIPYELTGAQVTIKDVTVQRQLEKLQQDFVANVSHELRTPLTSITGFIETLRMQQSLTEEEKSRIFEIIEIESSRLLALISELLTLSKIENSLGKKQPETAINIERILEDTLVILNNKAIERNIVIKVSVDEKLPEVYGEPEWFRMIVANLCENAIKYSHENGEVHLAIKEDHNNLIITVEDNGVGIPEKDIPFIFERFYRVDKARSRKVGGNGLGLSIVKYIVEEWGGNIYVTSKIGIGSEFKVAIDNNYRKAKNSFDEKRTL